MALSILLFVTTSIAVLMRGTLSILICNTSIFLNMTKFIPLTRRSTRVTGIVPKTQSVYPSLILLFKALNVECAYSNA